MKRERGLDFVRAVSVIGIVAFHFYVHSSSEQKLFLTHANGAWGGTLNYLLFALSGLVLHTQYGSSKALDLKLFYYKRWKSTMPAHILVFSAAFIMRAVHVGRLFYLPIPKARLLLALIGMDGYFNMIFPTYFLTGEWFLGAILILYVVYPLLRILVNQNKYITLLGMIALYVLFLKVDFLGMRIAVNPVTCMLSFCIGIFFAEIPTIRKHPAVALLSTVCLLYLLKNPIDASSTSREILTATTLLITIGFAGEFICKNRIVYLAVSTICSFGYYIFLIHHRIITTVLKRVNPVDMTYALLLFVAILLIVFFFAYILDIVMKKVFNSKLFLKFENAVISSK